MGTEILVPVKDQQNCIEIKIRYQPSWKANSHIIKEDKDTNQMIAFFERENKAAI